MANITGSEGTNDVLHGTEEADFIVGAGGEDSLFGEGGDDVIDGGGASDKLYGGAGNDYLLGGGASDQLYGEDGDDTLIGGPGDRPDTLYGGPGNDTMLAGPIYSTYYGDDGTDVVSFASRGSGLSLFLDNSSSERDRFFSIELLIGTAFNDRFFAGATSVRLDGGSGFDTLAYTHSLGPVTINLSGATFSGGWADDDSATNIEWIAGSQYGDQFIGDAAANIFEGHLGADFFIGGLGADTFIGGQDFDMVSYEDNHGPVVANLASGQGSGNAAQGDAYSGIEQLRGTLFADALFGDANTNLLDGNAGDDFLIGGLGGDVFVGGLGTDMVSYEDNYGAVYASLTLGGFGNAAQGDTYSGVEQLRGTLFNDTLAGDSGINLLDGNSANDVLLGGLGADLLIGGAGNDTASYADNWGAVYADLGANVATGNAAQGDSFSAIENLTGSAYYDTLFGDGGANRLAGGDGNDVLYGALGTDEFLFDTALNGLSNVDHILDFAVATDRFLLDDAIFGMPTGALLPNSFISGVPVGGLNRIIYDSAAGALYFDPDGSGPQAAIQFALLAGHPPITAADFLVI